MGTLEGIIAGLTLIKEKGGGFNAAEHDEIYAGDVEGFTPEELQQMEKWGWYVSEYGGFIHYV